MTASIAPVLVASALAFTVTGSFNWPLFILALVSIMLLHSGANVANDYFDHVSKNDWLNKNPTPFSGGVRFIQQSILSPKETIFLSLALFAAGCATGLIIIYLTKSIFILILGIIGCFGGFFYTALPFKFGYRTAGEIVIALLFGLLPVAGSFYLQTGYLDWLLLFPAAIVSILIFLVILINEFPDRDADAAVKKRTLVVSFGLDKSILIYRIFLIATYLIAVTAMFLNGRMFYAGLLFLLTLPLAVAAMRFTNKKVLSTPQNTTPNRFTIILHLTGSVALTAGFVIFAFTN